MTNNILAQRGTPCECVVEKCYRVTQKTIAPANQIDIQTDVIVYRTQLMNVEIPTSCKRDR